MIETIARQSIRPLEEVLAYRNELVIDSFTSKLDVSREEAERIFLEAKRWLWYIASTMPTQENPEAHAIDEPMFIIDEMWHAFILITRDYMAFCDQMFGRYIHHAPGFAGAEEYGAQYVLAEGDDFIKNTLAQTMARKRAKYTDIYERLGEEAFLTWYRDFPQAYPVDAIRRLRTR